VAQWCGTVGAPQFGALKKNRYSLERALGQGRGSQRQRKMPTGSVERGTITGCRARMDAKPQATAVALPPNRCAGRHCRCRWKRVGRLMCRDVANIRNIELTNFYLFFSSLFLTFVFFFLSLQSRPPSPISAVQPRAEPSALQLHLRRVFLVFPR